MKKPGRRRSYGTRRKISATWWRRYVSTSSLVYLLSQKQIPTFIELNLFPLFDLQNASKRKRKHEKDGKSSKKKDFKF